MDILDCIESSLFAEEPNNRNVTPVPNSRYIQKESENKRRKTKIFNIWRIESGKYLVFVVDINIDSCRNVELSTLTYYIIIIIIIICGMIGENSI